MTIYNAELIESIQVFDREVNGQYYWLNGFNFLGINWVTAGWRGRWTGEIITEEEIKKGYILENGVVYYKPYTLMRCASGQTKITKFDTFEEAKRAASDIASKFNIKLTL